MKRFGFLVRPPWFTACVGSVLFVVRGIASLGTTATRFPDSVGYETFSLWGHTDRSWPVTFVYALVRSDGGRVFVQILLGCLAWMWLGSELARRARWPRTILVATALLSLSPQIVRYDAAILSESLGITYAVMAVAATLRKTHDSTRTATVVWLACVALCGFTRPTHLIVVIAVSLPHAIRLVTSRGRRLSATGAVVFVMLLFGVVQQRNSSHMSLLNLYTVVSSRVITDDGRFDWFVDKGMPDVAGMRSANGYDYAGDLPPDVAAIVDLPEGQQPPALMRVGGVTLAQWLKDNGWRTLALYLAAHPGDTLGHARDLLDPTLSPGNGDFLPLANGPMIPGFLFGTWQAWAVSAFAGVLLLWFRSRRDAIVLASTGVVTAIVYLATVHSSGIEHVRHSVTVASMVRVIGLCAVVRALAPRDVRQTPDATASERN